MAIHITTFGGFHAYRDDVELDRLAGKRLRAALLVYLAVERSVPRESLLALFWPESNTENARHALRQTLYQLRTELGAEWLEVNALEVRASAGVGVDVHEFDAAIQRAQPDQAARLYRGPFLSGVNLIDVQPWENWVDGKRAQYARAFRKACRGWVDERRSAHDLEGAIEAAQHWVVPDPLDDEAQHRLISLLAEAGERTAALRQYEAYERLLQTEELHALDDTIALVERIRSDVAVPRNTGADRAVAGSIETTPDTIHTTRQPGLRLALITAAVLLVVGGVFWGVTRDREPVPASGPPGIAVLPFSVRGERDAAYLSEGMVNLLGTALDGASVRPVDARALFSIVAQHRDVATPDLERGSRVASRLGAGWFVMGDVVNAGSQLRIEAAVYRTGRWREPIIRAAVGGSASHVFELVDSLAARLLAGLGAPPRDRLTRTAAVTTSSLAAFKEYLQGETELRAGRFERAEEAYVRAVTYDSTFAVAHYRLALARDWAAHGGAEEAARAAARHAQRLTPRDRALLEALLAHTVGDAPEAERRYRAILARYPDDLEAWLVFGEVLSHFGPVQGRSISEMELGWRRVLEYEPKNVAAVLHLARLAVGSGRAATVDSLLAPFSAAEQMADRRLVQIAALRAIVRSDTANLRALIQHVRGWEDPAAWQFAAYLTAFAPAPGHARQAVQALAERRGNAGTVGDFNWFAALLHLEAGQLETAQRLMAAAYSAKSSVPLEWHRRTVELITEWWTATLPFAYPDSMLERTRRTASSSDIWLWSVQPSGDPPITSADPLWSALTREAFGPPGRMEALRLYTIGTLSLRLRDHAAVRSASASLSRLAASSDADWLVRAFDSELRARRTWQAGDPREALRILDKIELGPVSVGATNVVPFMAHAQRRYLRGELLMAAGRYAEALPWFASLGSLSVPESPLRGPAHLRQAEIYEHLRQREQATQHYRQVIELWSDADPEVATLRAVALQRLRALR